MPPQRQSSISSMTGAIEFALDLAKDPAQTRWVMPALLVIDAVLCALIIKTTNYTEIDWTTYMQQVQQYLDGERVYTKIEGDTGPLVYPAVHLFIYRALYAMTNRGTNIVLAQCYFGVLYVFNLGLVMACYRLAKAPPYIFPMLILSKRLHSIYLLRCFNDCFAVTFLFLAIYLFQKRHWAYGAVAFSAGIGVKMSLLVALPAVLLLLYQAKGPTMDLWMIVVYMSQVQFLPSLPFTSKDARAYVSRAFQFDRAFKYEWTVNWRFVPEETFSSARFSYTLLAAHAVLLLIFAATRWTMPLGRSPRDLARLVLSTPDAAAQKSILRSINSDFILTTVLTSVAIGMLCARSLHYQFFAYIAWATPFLLWKAKLHPALVYFVWFGEEAAWNVFPSVDISSKIVVGTLAAVVFNVWTGTGEDVPRTVEDMAERVLLANTESNAGAGVRKDVIDESLKPSTGGEASAAKKRKTARFVDES